MCYLICTHVFAYRKHRKLRNEKNGIFAGKQDAHICLKEDDMPNVLFPKISKVGTMRPIKGPATYQGQGCLTSSIKFIITI